MSIRNSRGIYGGGKAKIFDDGEVTTVKNAWSVPNWDVPVDDVFGSSTNSFEGRKSSPNRSYFDRLVVEEEPEEFVEPFEDDSEFESSFIGGGRSYNQPFDNNRGFSNNYDTFGSSSRYGKGYSRGDNNRYGRQNLRGVVRENLALSEQVGKTFSNVLGFGSSGRNRQGAGGVIKREVEGIKRVVKDILNEFRLW